MTIGETQYQFNNFKLEGGALQFPALAAEGTMGPSITVVNGAFEAATKLALATLTGGQLAQTTPLVLNGQQVLVNTSSLVAFGKATTSSSEKAEDITQIIKELTSEPEMLGNFILARAANANLTGELEKLAGASEADKAAVKKADTRLKVRVATDLSLLKPVALSTEAVGAIELVIAKSKKTADENAAQVANYKKLSRPSKAAVASYSVVKKVASKAVAGAAASAALATSAVKKAASVATDLATKENAKKVALAASTVALLTAATATNAYFDSVILQEPELELVVEAAAPLVKETSHALYAVAILGTLAIGAGAEKLALKAKQFVKDAAQVASVATQGL